MQRILQATQDQAGSLVGQVDLRHEQGFIARFERSVVVTDAAHNTALEMTFQGRLKRRNGKCCLM